MRILLVGEYSRLHNSLKEGLERLGHQVSINGLNDGFKDYPIDFRIYKKWDHGFLKKMKIALYKLTGFNITSFLTYRQVKKNKSRFSGFDIVQLINENSFLCDPTFEIKIIDILLKNNTKLFLLSCGSDYVNVKFSFENRTRKSVLSPYFEKKASAKDFENALKFRQESFKKLHYFIYKNCNGIIASDLDYHIPLLGDPKYLGLIPNPINTEKLELKDVDSNTKINIFLGINNQNYLKKGCDYFEKAVAVIQEKYPDKVEVTVTRSIPYSTYINLYNQSHIVLDQVYAFDQGYNALEAMAKGKVVFTGAEKEFTDYYQLTEKVAVNALPDVGYLVEALSYLIENPSDIISIGENARAFIEKEHHYIKIAEKYLETWTVN